MSGSSCDISCACVERDLEAAHSNTELLTSSLPSLVLEFPTYTKICLQIIWQPFFLDYWVDICSLSRAQLLGSNQFLCLSLWMSRTTATHHCAQCPCPCLIICLIYSSLDNHCLCLSCFLKFKKGGGIKILDSEAHFTTTVAHILLSCCEMWVSFTVLYRALKDPSSKVGI